MKVTSHVYALTDLVHPMYTRHTNLIYCHIPHSVCWYCLICLLTTFIMVDLIMNIGTFLLVVSEFWPEVKGHLFP